MKKYLMISAAAVAVFSMSCSKIEDTSAEQEIGFAVASYVPQTKSGELSIIDVDGVRAFKCKAFLHSNGADAGTNYFGDNGETITYNGSNAWTPSHPYYWPKHPQSYINFVSWYDKNGTPGTVTETSMIWENRTIAADDNIMFADEAWRFKGNAKTYQKDGVNAGVPTLFHHALAKVKFQFNASPLTDPNDPNTTFEVKLQTVSLSSVHKQGTLTLTNADPGATRQIAWTPDVPNYFWLAKDAASNIAMVSSNTDLTETPAILYPSAADQSTYSITAQSVLPQQVTDAMVLSITYAITIKYTYNGSTTIILAEQDIPAYIQLNTLKTLKNGSNVAITDWLPNKIYTYSITINPLTDQILIDPAIDADWATENVTATIE